MNIHLLQPSLLRHFQQGPQVGVVGVNAAVAEQAVKMQGAAVLKAGVHGGAVGGILKKAAVLNGPGNPGQILIHHTAASDVGVAHLAVAHLSVRKAHVQSGGGERGVLASGKQLVQDRGFRVDDGVSVRIVSQAETVHNNQSSGCFIHNDLIPRFS